MARKVSFSAMESRSARLNKFTIRRRPYSGPSLARGILLLYRRNKTNGTWVLKVSDGQGAYWTKGFALADDFEDADGKTVEAEGFRRKTRRRPDAENDACDPGHVDETDNSSFVECHALPFDTQCMKRAITMSRTVNAPRAITAIRNQTSGKNRSRHSGGAPMVSPVPNDRRCDDAETNLC